MGIVQESFKRLHYPTEIILLCLRWYLSYSLSLRNLEEMILERGIIVDHSTIHRWIGSVALRNSRPSFQLGLSISQPKSKR